jgi:hypothetical protein
MRVARGADGQGTPALRCSTCHQETNGELPHSPPGGHGRSKDVPRHSGRHDQGWFEP